MLDRAVELAEASWYAIRHDGNRSLLAFFDERAAVVALRLRIPGHVPPSRMKQRIVSHGSWLYALRFMQACILDSPRFAFDNQVLVFYRAPFAAYPKLRARNRLAIFVSSEVMAVLVIAAIVSLLRRPILILAMSRSVAR